MDWLVAKLAGDRVERECVLPAGEDPPYWNPGLDVITALQEADLVVANGADFEKWMATVTLPPGRVVKTASGLDLITLAGVTHSHGVHGEHSHEGLDPHTWSDPAMFSQQAERVAEALIRIDPEGTEAYLAALSELQGSLMELDAAYRDLFGRLGGEYDWAANHPAYNYLARSYGLEIRDFALDPGEVPGKDTVAEVEAWTKGASGPVMLWEEPPAREVVESLPGGIRHVWIDPLEQPPEGGAYDYLAQARANIDRLPDSLLPPARLAE